jgi:hypothetical protein
MKVYIVTDEWYPVFSVGTELHYTYGNPVEITEEQLDRIERAFKEFNDVQGLLEDLINEVKK